MSRLRADERVAAKYRGEAITRAGRALDAFSGARGRLSLEELAAAAQAPKETLRGVLDTLASHGLLLREDDSYRLGYGWLRLAALRRSLFDARAVAMPLMRRIRDAINETVVLSMRAGDRRVHIDFVESTHPVRRLAQIGSSGELHAGATGLALTSTLSEREFSSYVERCASLASSEARRKLQADLAALAAEGCAIAVGSIDPDMAAVAAACRLHNGESVALTVSCPLERFDPAKRRDCARLVKGAIAEVSLHLGHTP